MITVSLLQSVYLNRPLEEALAGLAGEDAVVESGDLVATDGAGTVDELLPRDAGLGGEGRVLGQLGEHFLPGLPTASRFLLMSEVVEGGGGGGRGGCGGGGGGGGKGADYKEKEGGEWVERRGQ